MLPGQFGQVGFGVLGGFGVHGVGQPVHEAADHRHMGGAEFAGALGGGGGGQPWLEWFAGDRAAWPEVFGVVDASAGLGRGDAQPTGQRKAQRAAQLGFAGLFGELVDQRMLDGGQAAADRLATFQ